LPTPSRVTGSASRVVVRQLHHPGR
jgi:hypothetical protein